MLKRSIKILIADSQYLTRQGLKCLFAGMEDIRIVGESTDKYDLFQKLKNFSIDIVILDHTHQDNFHLSDISLIQTISPATKILIICDIDNAETVKSIIGYGVTGFLTKTCDSKEIFDAVYALMKGEKMFCHKVVNILHNKPVYTNTNCEPEILSDREIEIIRLIASGYTTREIAETLFRSFHTISTHRKNIMKKLGKNSASELMVYAMNNRLIEPATATLRT
ncbi:MAG: response regulator transcription factor [Chitinophagales bacterium]